MRVLVQKAYKKDDYVRELFAADSQKHVVQDNVVSIVNELLSDKQYIDNTNSIRLNLDKSTNNALKDIDLRKILQQ